LCILLYLLLLPFVVNKVYHWEIRKVVNGLSFIMIRQMVALVRRALAEVCTVPVLLVIFLSVGT